MKNRTLLDSFNNAANGMIHAFRTERNIKIHLAAAVIVLGLSMFYDITRTEFMIVCMTIAIVIICELFNTSIEVLVDTLIGVYHPKAKIIKDTAAAAVFLSALMSLAVAYFIFFDRVSTSLESGIQRVRNTPMHITVIAVVVTMLAVVLIKAFTKSGTAFSGGMPSGHAALSIALTTAIALWTENTSITIIVFV
ncbi:MAG: diacylglycerol kinase, partial [Clostridiales bacterium]|nr:diacylglycerol kinase [Clostridiales bacterium]